MPVILLFLILFFNVNSTQACSCGANSIYGGAGLASPIITIPAHTLERGKFTFSTGINYQNFDEFTIRQLQRINSRRVHTHSFSSLTQVFASLAYGITDDLDIIVTYPFNVTSNLLSTFDGLTIDEGDSVGLGDLTLITKYRFLNSEKHRLSGALLAGVKFPTGRTSEVNEFGFALAADDQPGSGSYDPIMGFAISKQFDNFNLDANALYRLSTVGFQDVIVGDVVNFNMAVSHPVRRFLPKQLLGQDLDWSLVSEINGVWQERTEFKGIKDDAHGGLVVNWLNGFKVAINRRLITSFGFAFPVINDLNGTQPEAGFSLISNLSWIF